MKAVICTHYGPPKEVLQLKEVEKPLPKDNEVLIRVFSTTVSKGDCELRSMKLPASFQLLARIGFGFRGPRKKILGQELSGEVESVGKQVKEFKRGDQVFAYTGFHLGAYAEYDCLSEKGLLALKPTNLTYEEAAAVPLGGLHALHFLRKANIQSGQLVLINGAGGSIGTFGVKFAKSLGAEVTAVDSGEKLEMLRSIGADHVIDYSKEDFTKSGKTYDVIFDVVGKSSFAGCIKSLNEKGFYLLGNPGLSDRMRGAWTTRRSTKKVVSELSYKREDITSLKELLEKEKIGPVIDRRYPLEKIPEAHEYVDTGQKLGNVVIVVRK